MKIISFIFSSIFAIVFYSLLLIFHPIQWIGLTIFGYKGHKFVVDYMYWFLTKSLLTLGVNVTVENKQELPENTTLIFVSNHQGMFDIPPIIWAFRKYHPKFVSKIELGKGIPSISYNLRHGGSVLIDRNNRRQSLPALADFGKRLQQNNETGVIFPEGTRSKDGKPKPFSKSGLKILTRNMPDGYIVPVTLNVPDPPVNEPTVSKLTLLLFALPKRVSDVQILPLSSFQLMIIPSLVLFEND